MTDTVQVEVVGKLPTDAAMIVFRIPRDSIHSSIHEQLRQALTRPALRKSIEDNDTEWNGSYLILPHDWKLETLSESEMRELGWCRCEKEQA